jgi:predicted nuclease of predicted toxin-antitoxin system
MHPFGFPLLADENIAPDVIEGLRSRGADVAGVIERGHAGRSDDDLLNVAFEEGRVVVTHDSDFGALAVRVGLPLVGIIYLRPGHIHATEVLRQIDAVRALEIEAHPPFVLVAERRGEHVKVRLRRLR